MDPFQVLNIPPTASDADILQAYNFALEKLQQARNDALKIIKPKATSVADRIKEAAVLEKKKYDIKVAVRNINQKLQLYPTIKLYPEMNLPLLSEDHFLDMTPNQAEVELANYKRQLDRDIKRMEKLKMQIMERQAMVKYYLEKYPHYKHFISIDFDLTKATIPRMQCYISELQSIIKVISKRSSKP